MQALHVAALRCGATSAEPGYFARGSGPSSSGSVTQATYLAVWLSVATQRAADRLAAPPTSPPSQPGYRLYVIGRCKKLKMLDFRKVKQKVRSGLGWRGCWTAAVWFGGAAGQRAEWGGGAIRWCQPQSGQLAAARAGSSSSASPSRFPPRRAQEREEAERLYGAAPQQAPATFEPEEELAQVGGWCWLLQGWFGALSVGATGMAAVDSRGLRCRPQRLAAWSDRCRTWHQAPPCPHPTTLRPGGGGRGRGAACGAGGGARSGSSTCGPHARAGGRAGEALLQCLELCVLQLHGCWCMWVCACQALASPELGCATPAIPQVTAIKAAIAAASTLEEVRSRRCAASEDGEHVWLLAAAVLWPLGSGSPATRLDSWDHTPLLPCRPTAPFLWDHTRPCSLPLPPAPPRCGGWRRRSRRATCRLRSRWAARGPTAQQRWTRAEATASPCAVGPGLSLGFEPPLPASPSRPARRGGIAKLCTAAAGLAHRRGAGGPCGPCDARLLRLDGIDTLLLFAPPCSAFRLT